MTEIHSDDPAHAEALCRKLNPSWGFRPGFDRAISFTRGGKLIGGVIYDEYRGRSIQMHVVGLEQGWVTRDGLWAVFHYPFEQLGVDVVFGFVEEDNHRAMAFDRHVGFTEHTRLKGACRGGDLVILSMYRADCRWLKIRPRTICRGSNG